MSGPRGGSNKKHSTRTKQDEDQDEVEKLLRATEDDILLKLSVDSHMSRGSSSHIIHPDLDRRFQALRSSSSSSNSKPPASSAKASVRTPGAKLNKESDSVVDGNDGKGDGDDLFARFAALKATLPSYSKESGNVGSDGVDGDEVDEVIRWAIDAAALDPSPPSDDDATDASSDDQTDDDDDDDDEDDDIKKKDKKKKEGRK